MKKNQHFRKNRDGTVIKLDVNSGVCSMDMWCVLMRLVARTVSDWSVTNKLVRQGRSAAVEVKKAVQSKS